MCATPAGWCCLQWASYVQASVHGSSNSLQASVHGNSSLLQASVHGNNRLALSHSLFALSAASVLGLLASWLGIWATLGCLTIAAGGIWATHGPLFSWPAEFLEPQAGALAFALMKSLGACGGFAGPLLVGVLAQAGAGFGGAMLLLAAVCTTTALVVAGAPGVGSGVEPSQLHACCSWRVAGFACPIRHRGLPMHSACMLVGLCYTAVLDACITAFRADARLLIP